MFIKVPMWLRSCRKIAFNGVLQGAALFAAGCESNPSPELVPADDVRAWTLALRSQQVIPVYPLTSDLRPGDVLLIHNADVTGKILPFWEDSFLPIYQRIGNVLEHLEDPPVSRDHEAAFASIELQARRDASRGTSLSFEGISAGLSLLGTKEAKTIVSISSARTSGVDLAIAARAMKAWWGARGEEVLSAFSYHGTSFIGVELSLVTRVFSTTAVDISLIAEGSGEGSSEVKLGNGDFAIGGNLKVQSLLKRSATIREQFERPLVFGMHAASFVVEDRKLAGFSPDDMQVLWALEKARYEGGMGNVLWDYRLVWWSLEEVYDLARECERLAGDHASDFFDSFMDRRMTELQVRYRKYIERGLGHPRAVVLAHVGKAFSIGDEFDIQFDCDRLKSDLTLEVIGLRRAENRSSPSGAEGPSR